MPRIESGNRPSAVTTAMEQQCRRSVAGLLTAAAMLLGSLTSPAAAEPVDNSALLPPVLPDDQVALEGISPDWVKSLIMMELRIETLTEEGTFDAAISKLDHFAEMGVNGIWVGPVFDRAMDGRFNNGYKNFGPHTLCSKLTGTPDLEESYRAVRRFVDAAHQRNIRVFSISSPGESPRVHPSSRNSPISGSGFQAASIAKPTTATSTTGPRPRSGNGSRIRR